jgi:hydrogenase/urease accessory protein HupE
MSRLVAIVALSLVLAPVAAAHEVRPAYLELRETTPGVYDVLWKVPALGDDLRLSIFARFPADTQEVTEPRGLFRNDAYVERWQIQRPGGLAGHRIVIDGLSATRIDALVRVTDIDGVTQTGRATPDAPSVTIGVAASGWSVVSTYLALGVKHILLGIDHLLFVLALVMLVEGWKKLAATITAFTIAHSFTLAAATLGFVQVPGPPVEACIALSIVFVAAEIVRGRQGHAALTARWPWVVSFTFGLLHGLGFAGALNQVGLPQQAIPLALLHFNLGVEIGQLLFVAAVLSVLALVRRFRFSRAPWLQLAPPYAIGAMAMFWVIQRISAF